MQTLIPFLKSYTAFHAVENCAALLRDAGFSELEESKPWQLEDGKAYFVVRGGSSIIAFRYAAGGAFRIIATHTDSPCFKLKANCVLADERYTRLNAEPYGGGLWYTFFDRPLAIAGRKIRAAEGVLREELYTSPYFVTIPSLAIHMAREANDGFAPNLQTELPLAAIGKRELAELFDGAAQDLFLAPATEPYFLGEQGELLSSPRLDNLTGVCASMCALKECETGSETLIAAAFDSEEIGSRTRQGAASDFLESVLLRIAAAENIGDAGYARRIAGSFLVSLDNAHALHPNHPEKCDLTNKPVLGGGIAVKGHAGGAYTTDALSFAVIGEIFRRADVKYQTFYNRSDMRSGSTLGAISLGKVSMPAVDLGIAQLAMHSAVETMAVSDYEELVRGCAAFFAASFTLGREVRFA